jgi:hypothetical protein
MNVLSNTSSITEHVLASPALSTANAPLKLQNAIDSL